MPDTPDPALPEQSPPDPAEPEPELVTGRSIPELRRRRRALAALVTLVVVLAVAVGLQIGTHGGVKHTPKQTASSGLTLTPVSVSDAKNQGMKVSAWLPYWDDGSGLASFQRNASKFSSLHLFWYEARSATDIHFQAKKATQTKVHDIAKKAGVRLIPTLTETMNTADFTALLNDTAQRSAHVAAVCRLVTDNGYDGIDLDYESFALKVDPANVAPLAQLYSTFVGQVADCLHVKHKQVEVTVIARTSDQPFASLLSTLASGVYDYQALGKVADIVQPMAYDYHYPSGSPGPIDPVDWVDSVASYTAGKVPARKVMLGLPLYGQDWSLSKSGATAVTASRGPTLAAQNGVEAHQDDASKSLLFSYLKNGDLHQVWYDDSQATQLRIGIAQNHHFNGVIFWALGDEDSSFWQ